MGMTPAVSLTAQSLEPAQAFAEDGDPSDPTPAATPAISITGATNTEGTKWTAQYAGVAFTAIAPSETYNAPTVTAPSGATAKDKGSYTFTATPKDTTAGLQDLTATLEITAAPAGVNFPPSITVPQGVTLDATEAEKLILAGITMTGVSGETLTPKITLSGSVNADSTSISYTLNTTDSAYSNYSFTETQKATQTVSVVKQASPVDNQNISDTMVVNFGTPSSVYTGASLTPAVSVSVPTGNGDVPVVTSGANANGTITTTWAAATQDPGTIDTAGQLVNVGAYKATVAVEVTIDGVKYTGTKVVDPAFTVTAAPIQNQTFKLGTKVIAGNSVTLPSTVTAATAEQYITENLSVAAGATTLTKGTDYTLSVNSANNTITITGDGNYANTKVINYTLSYAITDKNVTVTADGKSEPLVYSATALTPKVVVTNPSDPAKKLVEGVDYTISYTKNGKEIAANEIVNAGNYAVVIKAVEGSIYDTGLNGVTVPFKVQAFELTEDNIEVSGIDSITYTGEPIAQPSSLAITATIGTTKVPLSLTGTDNDVTVAWASASIEDACTAANPYEVAISAGQSGNYTVAANTTFDVVVKPAAIQTSDITVDYGKTGDVANTALMLTANNANSVNLGSAIKVKVNKKDLALGTNYSLYIAGTKASVTNIAQPGNYNVVVEGLTNYTGKPTVQIAVRSDISQAGFEWASEDAPEYTGQAVTPAFTVYDTEGNPLTAGVDYTVAWKNNVNAGIGTASVVITGTGNTWAGTMTQNFAIKGEEAFIKSVKVEEATYDGNEQTPEVTIVVTDAAGKVIPGVQPVVLPVGADKYVDANTYEIKVATEGKYMVTPYTTTFTIDPADLSKLVVEPVYPAGSDAYLLNAKTTTIDPEFSVQIGGKTVALTNKDIKITTNGVISQPGKYNITIEGVEGGNYATTSVVVPINVLQDIDLLYVAPIAAVTYNGKAQTPEFVVWTSKEAAEATTPNVADQVPASQTVAGKVTENYAVSWNANTNAGTAQLVITGKGSYGGTKTVDFTINKAPATIEFTAPTATYTGSAVKPEPAVTLKSDVATLTSGKDFVATYAYGNNVNVGTATITVNASGAATNNYAFETVTKDWTITAANIADATYTGETQVAVGKQPKVSFTFNGKTLVAGTDFDVTGTPVVDKAGKANLTVTGKGNFTGTKTIEITVGKSSNTDEPSSTAGWQQNATGWWYDNGDNSYPTNTWKEIDGKWYHFNKWGYMETGWVKDGGTWYYCNKWGHMTTGWQLVDGIWYYMNKWGAMQSGWQKIGGDWYYMNQWGHMAASQWVGPYWVDASGRWIQ